MRRIVGAAAENHLFRRANFLLRSVLTVGNPDALPPLEDQALPRAQVTISRFKPPRADRSAPSSPGSVRGGSSGNSRHPPVGPVVMWRKGMTSSWAAHEPVGQRRTVIVLNLAPIVAAKFRIAALFVVFCASEVGQHFLIRPTPATALCPAIEIRGLPRTYSMPFIESTWRTCPRQTDLPAAVLNRLALCSNSPQDRSPAAAGQQVHEYANLYRGDPLREALLWHHPESADKQPHSLPNLPRLRHSQVRSCQRVSVKGPPNTFRRRGHIKMKRARLPHQHIGNRVHDGRQ